MSRRRSPSRATSQGQGAAPSAEHWLFCVLGASPAVLTEALWVLAHQRRRRIDRVEVWTTLGPGRAAWGLPFLREEKAWRRLERALELHGGEPLPPFELGRTIDFRLFERDGKALSDIRTPQDND